MKMIQRFARKSLATLLALILFLGALPTSLGEGEGESPEEPVGTETGESYQHSYKFEYFTNFYSESLSNNENGSDIYYDEDKGVFRFVREARRGDNSLILRNETHKSCLQGIFTKGISNIKITLSKGEKNYGITKMGV